MVVTDDERAIVTLINPHVEVMSPTISITGVMVRKAGIAKVKRHWERSSGLGKIGTGKVVFTTVETDGIAPFGLFTAVIIFFLIIRFATFWPTVGIVWGSLARRIGSARINKGRLFFGGSVVGAVCEEGESKKKGYECYREAPEEEARKFGDVRGPFHKSCVVDVVEIERKILFGGMRLNVHGLNTPVAFIVQEIDGEGI